MLVRPDLSVPDHPEVFVIGDAAAVQGEKGEPVPGVAPAAKQMGRYVGRLIAARIAGKSLPVFRYRNLGELATIGRRAAVVKGFMGWLFWSLAHIYFLIGVRIGSSSRSRGCGTTSRFSAATGSSPRGRRRSEGKADPCDFTRRVVSLCPRERPSIIAGQSKYGANDGISRVCDEPPDNVDIDSCLRTQHR